MPTPKTPKSDKARTATAKPLRAAPGYTAREVSRAIHDEPELPGPMPDEMWAAISTDRDAAAELLRILVRQTKDGIRKRLNLEPYSEKLSE